MCPGICSRCRIQKFLVSLEHHFCLGLRPEAKARMLQLGFKDFPILEGFDVKSHIVRNPWPLGTCSGYTAKAESCNGATTGRALSLNSHASQRSHLCSHLRPGRFLSGGKLLLSTLGNAYWGFPWSALSFLFLCCIRIPSCHASKK